TRLGRLGPGLEKLVPAVDLTQGVAPPPSPRSVLLVFLSSCEISPPGRGKTTLKALLQQTLRFESHPREDRPRWACAGRGATTRAPCTQRLVLRSHSRRWLRARRRQSPRARSS